MDAGRGVTPVMVCSAEAVAAGGGSQLQRPQGATGGWKVDTSSPALPCPWQGPLSTELTN